MPCEPIFKAFTDYYANNTNISDEKPRKIRNFSNKKKKNYNSREFSRIPRILVFFLDSRENKNFGKFENLVSREIFFSVNENSRFPNFKFSREILTSSFIFVVLLKILRKLREVHFGKFGYSEPRL